MPVSSEVDICNEALLLVGINDEIDGLDEATAEAAACNRFYARCRDSVLETMPWPFATRRQELAPLSGVEREDWEYVYALPEDCISPRAIVVEGAPTPAFDEMEELVIEANDAGDGIVLLSNVEDAELIYTGRIENVVAFPSLFVDALTWCLAGKLALPLLKGEKAVAARRMANDEYKRALADAFAAAMRSEHRVMPATASLRARSGRIVTRRGN